jgi:hypothetical protein
MVGQSFCMFQTRRAHFVSDVGQVRQSAVTENK